MGMDKETNCKYLIDFWYAIFKNKYSACAWYFAGGGMILFISKFNSLNKIQCVNTQL